MFYLKNWEIFCSEIRKAGIVTLRASDVVCNRPTGKFVIFKHDVETKPEKALSLAKIENQFGIRGSYYVQAFLLDNLNNLNILKEIQGLGHEVSYHYDVLDANDGDMNRANAEFKKNLRKFKSAGFEIKTVCQHGNPLKKRGWYTSNRDFFRNTAIAKEYSDISDIVVNFREKAYVEYSYVSDAGYSWNIISDPENNDRVDGFPNIRLNDLSDVVKLTKSGPSVIISTHPHRWESSKALSQLRIGVFISMRTSASLASKIPMLKKIINRFYYLAKNI